jgi:hypothetical protein
VVDPVVEQCPVAGRLHHPLDDPGHHVCMTAGWPKAGELLQRRMTVQRARTDELGRVNLLARLRAELLYARACQITVVRAAQRCLRDSGPGTS